MMQYPDMRIELSSHTDSQGSDEYNERLSQRRADNAKSWMVARGIAPERITAVGYGEKFILNHCKNGVKCTDEEHRYNRRTEFKILSGPTSITIEEEVKEEGQ
jgi:outer membrane protein OmpA-like peptidoglycan-associated protein